MFFGLFKRREKKAEVEEVRFNEISKWLNESNQIKAILSKLKNDVSSCLSKLSQAISKTESFLKDLERINLEERKANWRVKSLVLHNKTAYIEHVRHLLSRLKKEIDLVGKEYDLESIEKFVLNADNHIDVFSKQSFKSFHVTSELIGKELENVTRCISEISGIIKEINSIDKEKAKTVDRIKKSMESIAEKEKLIKNFNDEIANMKKEKQNITESIHEAEKKNMEIKGSDEWKKKHDIMKSIESLNEKLENNSSSLSGMFSSIEKALKKWAWKEKNKKAEAYLENPANALRQDIDFEIVDILEKVKEGIEKDSLELDEKRKEKLLRSIESITKEKLASFIKEEERIKEEIQEKKEELSKSKINIIDILPLLTQKNSITQEIEKLEKKEKAPEREIEEKKKEIEKEMNAIPARLI